MKLFLIVILAVEIHGHIVEVFNNSSCSAFIVLFELSYQTLVSETSRNVYPLQTVRESFFTGESRAHMNILEEKNGIIKKSSDSTKYDANRSRLLHLRERRVRKASIEVYCMPADYYFHTTYYNFF